MPSIDELHFLILMLWLLVIVLFIIFNIGIMVMTWYGGERVTTRGRLRNGTKFRREGFIGTKLYWLVLIHMYWIGLFMDGFFWKPDHIHIWPFIKMDSKPNHIHLLNLVHIQFYVWINWFNAKIQSWSFTIHFAILYQAPDRTPIEQHEVPKIFSHSLSRPPIARSKDTLILIFLSPNLKLKFWNIS